MVEHDAHRVLVAGREVALTRREFDLLAALAEHPGWVYDRDHLLLAVWGYSNADVETRVVDQHVANLRRKLETAGAHGLLETVRGVGYRLIAPIATRNGRAHSVSRRPHLTFPRQSPHGIQVRPA